MQTILIVILCSVLPVILAQFDMINENLGHLYIHAQVGNLPLKYIRMSELDEEASEKAADILDLLQIAPNVDPLKLAILPPLGIDIPYLLSGEVFMRNLLVAGVKQLQVHNIELRLINARMDLNVSLPQIYFEGDFHLQGTLGFFPIVFSCHISIILSDVRVTVAGGGNKIQVPTTGEVLQINSAEINIDIGNVLFNLTNTFIGGEEDKIEVGPATMQLFSKSNFKGTVFDRGLNEALVIANKELLKVPINGFMEYFMG